MSKKKTSAEDKKEKMFEIFFEQADFLSLKEVEKFAIKQKGISPMLVKQILQSLVDDDMVFCDKIGSSNYYWAFRSQAIKSRENRIEELQLEYKNQKDKLTAVDGELAKLREEQPCEEDILERDRLLSLISVKTKKVCDLESELKGLNELDPEVLNAKAIEAQEQKSQANNSTDDIFSILSWIKNKNPGVEDSAILAQIEAPADLDYLD